MMATAQHHQHQPPNTSKYFINPQHAPSPPNVYFLANPPDQQSTTPPSTNISPTNFINSQGLRKLRNPMYVPAALRPAEKNACVRPTDIPQRIRAPDTPPSSNENSYDDAMRPDSPATLEFTGFHFGHSPGSADSVRIGLSRATSETLSLEELGEVTGAPTTAHWKPDESAAACFVCKESFTWYFRRHHCRRCGNLVCDYHIKHNIPLDQNARIHPRGRMSKACNTCHDDWRILRKFHHSRAGSIAESSNSSQGTAMPIPNQGRDKDDMRVGSMARSEGGMVWSTF